MCLLNFLSSKSIDMIFKTPIHHILLKHLLVCFLKTCEVLTNLIMFVLSSMYYLSQSLERQLSSLKIPFLLLPSLGLRVLGRNNFELNGNTTATSIRPA